jgi:Skp family chaperone for outer membrane proteins
MKLNRLITAFVFVMVVAILPVLAQTKPTPTQPAPTQTGAAIPDSKIALIYSEQFLDSKAGIARFNTLLNTLNKEFEKVQLDLKQLEQKIAQLTDEIAKLQQGAGPGGVVPQNQIQAKTDQLEQLKKDYQRKGEDAQAAYPKRRGEIFQPLQDDIGKALEAYAKSHNINVIIDGSQVPVVYAAAAIDITRAFIGEFNSKNPATAAVTTPK